MKADGNCKQLLEDSLEEALAAKGFAKKIMRTRGSFSMSGGVLHKKIFGSSTETDDNVFVAGRVFQLTECSKTYQISCSCSARAAYRKKSRGRVMASARREVWWNGESEDLQRSFAGLIQVYLAKTATSFKFIALVAYPVYVIWLNCTERRRRYMITHGHTLLGFLPIGAVELRERDDDQDVDKGMPMHGFASSKVVPLEDPIAQTC